MHYIAVFNYRSNKNVKYPVNKSVNLSDHTWKLCTNHIVDSKQKFVARHWGPPPCPQTPTLAWLIEGHGRPRPSMS